MAINLGESRPAAVLAKNDENGANIPQVGSMQLPSVSEADNVARENMLATKRRYEEEIRETGLIDQLTSEIQLDSPETITSFGSKAAGPLSKVADEILSGYTIESVTKSGNMLNILANLMKQIDLEEIQKDPKEPKGIFAKFQQSLEEKVNGLIAKYQSIGGEMEKVCVELRVIKKELEVSNKELKQMYDVNIDYYRQLVAYILAGQQALDEIEEYYKQTEDLAVNTGDPTAQMQLQTITYARDLMEKKVLDLKTSESVALQALPIIQSMIYGNLNLSTEIENSFISIIPNFKTAIVLAVNNKKQYLQTKAFSGLREMAGEIIVKNAENSVAQMKRSAILSGTASIDVDKIEQSWDILMTGIRDTNELKAQLHIKRQDDMKRLTEINEKYLTQLHAELK